MHEAAASNEYAYGMWIAVFIHVGIFVWFIYSFAKPNSKIDWRSMGLFTSFIVALFVEMYGFPLTIYLLSSWLGSKYPVANPFSHENGHLWGVFFGGHSGHFSWAHLLSNVLIFGGIMVIAAGWKLVHNAKGAAVTSGVYAYVKHPQYSGFILVIVGFLIQWPTLITLLMAPILIVRYILLAKKEEKYMIGHHGKSFADYAKNTPMFIPRIGDLISGDRGNEGDTYASKRAR